MGLGLNVGSETAVLLTGGASPPADLRRSLSLRVLLLILSISSCCFSSSSLSFLATLLASWRRLISAYTDTHNQTQTHTQTHNQTDTHSEGVSMGLPRLVTIVYCVYGLIDV